MSGACGRSKLAWSLAVLGLFGLSACGGGGGGGGGTPPTQPPIPPTPPRGATFTADAPAGPNSIALAAGQGGSATVFVLDVQATSVSDVYGVSFELEFPRNLLTFRKSGTTEGVFLRGDDKEDTELIIENRPAGNLVVGYSRLGPVGGVEGSGLLFSISFTLVGNGSGSLTLKRTDVVDPLGEAQGGVTWIGGSIDVSLN
jgi:hypothetical protein